jgi:hypothetical protein
MRYWRAVVAFVLVGLTAGLLPASAAAQEICIVCEDPRSTYRCAAQDAPTRPGDVRLGLVCITELAKTGGHSSCSVSRKQSGHCEGILKTVSVGGGEVPAVLGKPAASPPGPGPGASQPVPEAKPKTGPPETVAELAKRTAEGSKEQLKKAGDGVSGAAKKTWRCLTSLFKEC